MASEFLRRLANDEKDKGVDERGARTTTLPGTLQNPVRNAANAQPMKKKTGTAAKTTANTPDTNLFRGMTLPKAEKTDIKNPIEALLEQQRKNREINQQIKAIGKTIHKGMTTEEYQQAAQKQIELQKQLPSASFTAGLLDSFSDAGKIIAKASGNAQYQAQNDAMQALLAQTMETNKGAALAGQMTGEFAKAAAGYQTIGKPAEKAAVATVGKLAGKPLGKVGTTAAAMLGQTAADTAVNTPITILAGLADEKSRGEIGKDIGKQVAMDAAFNIGLEGLGALGGIINARNAQKRIPQQTAVDWLENLYKSQPLMLPRPSDWYVGNDGSMYRSFAEKDLLEQTELQNGRKKVVSLEINPRGLDEFARKKEQPYQVYHGKQAMQTVIDEAQLQKKNKTITKQEQKGNILYLDKKRDLQQLPNSGVQFPESFNTDADPMFRIAQRSEDVKAEELGNISRGNKLEQAKEAAAQKPSGTDEKIRAKAQKMADNRNILAQRMTKDEIKALELEYENLKSNDYRQEQLRKINESGDTAAVLKASNSFDSRMKEIEHILEGQKAIRTNELIRTDAADEIGKIFGLTSKHQKKEIRRELDKTLTAIQEGSFTNEMKDGLFDLLYKQTGNNKKNSTNRLKNMLRQKKLTVDVMTAADIADIHSWNKALKGKLGWMKVGERESNIDAFYEKLSKEYPTYFPEGLESTAEKLVQIRQIAEMLDKGGGLDISDYRRHFDGALDRFFERMEVKEAYGEIMRERIGDFKSNLLGKVNYAETDPNEVKGWHDEARRLQAIADQNTPELNQMEQSILQGMLNGDMKETTAKKLTGARYNLIKQQYDIHKPLREIQEKISGWNRYRHSRHYDTAEKAVGDIHIGGKDGWKDKRIAAAYGRETQERNIYDIAPKETAERIIEMIFTPIHDNERKRILLMNDLKNMITPYHISTKNNINIALPGTGKKRCSESALVQYLGENDYKLRQMKASGAPEASYAELEKEIKRIEAALQPEQLQRINEGIKAFQDIYKHLHPHINKALIENGYAPIGYIEGYFPHMNFDDPDNIMGKAAQLLGFDFTSKELPMDIAGRTETFRPGRRWAGNLLKRTGEQTDYDALRAFDIYIDNISDVIYHTDDIQRLRAYEDTIRYKESDEGLKKQIDEVRKDKNLTPEERQEKLDKLYRENSKNHKLQNYVNDVRAFTDNLAGKKDSLDRPFETRIFGRGAYKVFTEIENRVAGNMVAGNIGSAMTNFIPITQALGSVKGTNMMKGMNEALFYLRKGGMDDLTKKSAFLTTREGSDLLYKTGLRKFGDNVAGKPMEIADKFSTQAVWRSKYYDNIGKGMTEEAAIRNADNFCRGLFGGRSKGAMPTLMQAKNPLIKPFTMFQLEVNNQLSYLLKDIPREHQGKLLKIANAYVSMAIGAYLYNDIYEKVTGRRSALDPLGIAKEALADFTGTEIRNTIDIAWDMMQGKGFRPTEQGEAKSTAQALTGLTANIGGNVPFVGGAIFDGGRIPLQSAIPGMESMTNAIGNVIDGGELETPGKEAIRKELEKPLWYLASPIGGGGQVKKTWEGWKTMKEGGRTIQSKDGEKLQFTVDQDSAGEWAKSLLFGQWATQGGRNYIENSRQILTAKQTETYKALMQAGVKNTYAFDTINRIRSHEKAQGQREEIRRSMLTKEQQAILYHNMVAQENSKDKEILDFFQGKESYGAAADCLSRIADCNGKQNESLRQRNILRNADLSDRNKEYIYLNKIITSDDTRETQKGKIAALRKAGVGMDAYLQIRNKFDLVNKSEKGKEKKTAFAQWLKEQGYTAKQQSVIKENFKFSGGFTMDW